MLLRFTLLCAALAAAIPGARAADKLVPLDAFVDQQQFSMPRLSPDGKHLAVNVRLKRGERSVPTVTIYSLPELQVVSTIALPAYEVPVNFYWITNRRLIVEKGEEVGERQAPESYGELLAVDFDGSKPEYLYGYKGFKLSSRGDRYGNDYGYGSVEYVPPSRDGHAFVGSHLWQGHSSLLYDINTNNSARRLMADIPMKNFSFVVQNDGTPRFAYGQDDEDQSVLFRRDDASGAWNRLNWDDLGARYHPFAFSADNKQLYVYHSKHGGPDELVREDMAGGTRTTLLSDPLGSVNEIEFSGSPRVPFAAASLAGIPKAHYIDETAPDAVLHKTLSQAFPDAYVHFINFTDDGQKLLFSVSSDRDPGSFYLYDKATAKAEMLLMNLPNLDAATMAERRPVTFTARDGLQVTGFLTLPHNPDKRKLPLVLLPHGGPFGIADNWYFDTDAQVLASRGYAVLQVNYRGSGGRGIGYKHAGYRQWGGKLVDDLVDGVKWAVARPDIDAGRVCAYGASYGGYAAMMAPVRAPSMFKCAVGYAGQYDLAEIYTEERVKGNARLTAFFVKTLGNDPAELAANSPTHLADKLKLPILMVHGDDDKTCPLPQAEQMRDALTRAGNPPEWMLVKREGHGFYDAGHRKEFYERLLAFLDKHIGH